MTHTARGDCVVLAALVVSLFEKAERYGEFNASIVATKSEVIDGNSSFHPSHFWS